MSELTGKPPQEVGAICTRWISEFTAKINSARREFTRVTAMALKKAEEIDDYINEVRASQPSEDRDKLIEVLVEMRGLLIQMSMIKAA